MSSPEVWAALGRAGNAQAKALEALREAEAEVEDAQERLAQARLEVGIKREALEQTHRAALGALNAAQADLMANGVAGLTKP